MKFKELYLVGEANTLCCKYNDNKGFSDGSFRVKTAKEEGGLLVVSGYDPGAGGDVSVKTTYDVGILRKLMSLLES